MKKVYAVIGGDLRQEYLAKLLTLDGNTVLTVGLDRENEADIKVINCKTAVEAIKEADYIILPLPYTTDKTTVNAPYARAPIPLNEVFGAVTPGQLVTGGKLDDFAFEFAKRRGFKLIDYFAREELEILNAIPTAEGAIQIALEELPITLHGSKCLVTGFGRVAKSLARRLNALGANVTASARSFSDIAWAYSYDCNTIPLYDLKKDINQFDVVFNTIPAIVIGEDLLSNLKKDCLVIDLASKPGGVDSSFG